MAQPRYQLMRKLGSYRLVELGRFTNKTAARKALSAEVRRWRRESGTAWRDDDTMGYELRQRRHGSTMAVGHLRINAWPDQ